MLYLNVFGSTASIPKTFEVDDPRTTVAALKQQLFPDAMRECQSVRFISAGRVLDDAAALSGCGLGRSAHLHVMVGERPAAPAAAEKPIVQATPVRIEPRGEVLRAGMTLLVILLVIVGGILALSSAHQRRRQLSLQKSQTAVIGAAVWGYVVLCHGLPMLCQALSVLHGSSSSLSCDSQGRCHSLGQGGSEGLRQRR